VSSTILKSLNNHNLFRLDKQQAAKRLKNQFNRKRFGYDFVATINQRSRDPPSTLIAGIETAIRQKRIQVRIDPVSQIGIS